MPVEQQLPPRRVSVAANIYGLVELQYEYQGLMVGIGMMPNEARQLAERLFLCLNAAEQNVAQAAQQQAKDIPDQTEPEPVAAPIAESPAPEAETLPVDMPAT